MPALKKVGDFTILEHLGKGGMGDVYSAIQEPLGRKVALKVLLDRGEKDPTARQRFHLEAQAISRLDHTNVVSLYNYGQENGLSYFSMQYIDGFSLDQAIPAEGLHIELVIDYAKQICRGLQYAHARKIVHRDIKPQNILIDSSGVCKISDFGIAQLFTEKITRAGMAVGTPEYMSPEQASGDPLDYRTDIYSLGIVLYEMLTGDVPFSGEKPLSIVYSHVHDIPQHPSRHRKNMPQRLELIILKCLKKGRTERYSSVGEILNDLDTVEQEEHIGVYAKPEKEDTPINRRITDRRMGDRRGAATGKIQVDPFVYPLFSTSFWYYTLRQQWISLILLILLGIHLIVQ
ncbi:serine/threonine protein kinase [Chitinivibrio alkaliphilus]|uniref:non-specific serine/threonine protein kinase n=1 Tax=Chitinivibrio alkaliphilus ACht1 TaxID=1313304 RepID=U7DBN4_9BACT|nr:serine/threonine-protein kinase [Chitinivibrio alkaliphilus]ERP38993.1 serine/threonine protein kinase [Chitinivibrio alkaliphilus ACht1]